MTPSPEGRRLDRRFRWEIEGLRAVAALLVAAYHVWFGRVSGGVDVFFVIAGFMVTTTLLGHLERTGRIDIGRYLGRLMQRLLPNALLVLAVVSVASWFLIPTTRRDEVFTEIAASALYYENWELARRSVDYLDRDFTNSPVQHFWAMSIQGQFYLIWLAVFLVVLRVGPASGVRRRIGAALTVLVLMSFVFSIWLTEVNQPAAYFNTGTRVWEFGIGGLLALSAPWWPALSRRWSWALGWAGLLAIISCGALLSVGTSFPGWIALWPVVGAALILLAGHTDAPWSASGLLSSTPLVRLGAVSYALYLWHWPLLVFTLVVTGQDRLGLLGGLAVIGVSIVLSFVSTHLVERPIRSVSLSGHRSWSVPVFLSLLVAPVAATGYAVASASSEVAPIATNADAKRYPGARAAGPDAFSLGEANTDEPAPGVVAAPDDIPAVYAQGCHQEQSMDVVEVCQYGDPTSDRTMILTGGSHSAHWQPALAVVAERTGWQLKTATKSSCRPATHLVLPQSTDPSVVRDADVLDFVRDSCRAWNAASADWILEQNPDLVVLTSTVGIADDEAVPTAYVRLWERFEQQGIEVLAIRDTPRPGRNIPDCLAQEGPLTRDCDTVREEVMHPASASSDLDPPPDNVTFADLTDYLCNDEICPPVIGNVVVYSDEDHLTRSYSRTLADALLEVAPVLR
ncbi:MAG: acyltransferase family protein [Ornithinimicrobium sp.]